MALTLILLILACILEPLLSYIIDPKSLCKHHPIILIKPPQALAIVRQEVAGAMADNEPIARYDSVKNLPYLKACLEESFRLSPPLARGPEHRTPPEGMKIMDEDIARDVVA
ncbi:hypothetical protein ASPVEDRAFT_34091 [Aspergillus versicolor CBS 583.65]|uniref:Cytochrome P450 n=1 Tax=Aspergillus versicolor CBS 583.65 TaxID=1036611 RepID=A0A1L9Q2I1_ASPVE|nr:uncharacterized protein ASPVEDRAFT_34091 [Aspergillus versicolor CBS 583.65]OJJ07912.1 hypothetical protein ASPVEDRAFT_34091 [Aspergillus versicolor CBS 583.65]